MRGSDGRPVSEANSFVFVFSLQKEWKTAKQQLTCHSMRYLVRV